MNGINPKKAVITFGVFDYFHLGHLRLFKQAREFGDYLIVGVQDEKTILDFKPDAKILYSTQQRVEMISALRIVDEVFVYSIFEQAVKEANFDVLALGEDHTSDRFIRAASWCRKDGKEVVWLKRTQNISSSLIKDNLIGSF